MTENTTASGAADDLHPVFTRVLPDLPDTKPFTLFKAGFRQALATMASAPVAPTDSASVLAVLDDLKDDAAAHISLEDLERCATGECTATVYSVRFGSPDGESVALFSRAQVAAALAAAPPAQLSDGARYRCRKCGEQNNIEFNSARIVTLRPDGSERDPRDIASDPEGKLMHSASEPLRAAVAPAPQPAPFNLRTQWLTVVYRGVEAGDEARIICEHPKVSAMSWSHALDDRDAAIAAAPKADHIPDAGKMAAAPQQGEYVAWPEPAVFDGVDRSGNPVSHGYSATQVNELLRADRAARGAAQAAPDVVEELIRERDHRDEIIDALCEAVLEDRPEWSSDYYFEDAVVAVQERIAELEVRKECRDLNAQAAPAPVAEDALHDMLEKILEGMDRKAYAPACMSDVDKIGKAHISARAQAAQPEGAKP